MNWGAWLIKRVTQQLQVDPYWGNKLPLDAESRSVHLAVFVEPFLQFVLNGKKTVESRFSGKRCPPFNTVSSDDVILLKRSGGPVVGLAEVASVWTYKIDKKGLEFIKMKFGPLLCVEHSTFWDAKKNSSYATLMLLHHVRPISPLRCLKRDRRGWVVVKRATTLFYE